MEPQSLFLAFLQDKWNQCQDRYMITHTPFLDLAQQSAAASFFKGLLGKSPLSGPGGLPFWPAKGGPGICFYGGYPQSERNLCLFFPDYLPGESPQELLSHLQSQPEDDPIALLRLTHSKGQSLSHRDYLGSLLGLGIKRETLGDISVREDGGDVLILRELSDFLLSSYHKAGRTSLKADLLSPGDFLPPQIQTKRFRDTVASLRLDSVIASAFQMSRTKAAEGIRSGLVYVDSLQTEKHDKPVSEGARLVFRGKGKAVLEKIEGTTKKDRILITICRYL